MIGLPMAISFFGDLWRLDGFGPWNVRLAMDGRMSLAFLLEGPGLGVLGLDAK
jgi:hypothetical protein